MFGRSRKGVVPARTPGELDAMEAAGRIVGRALVAVREAATPGATTADLDAVAEQVIRDAGAVPSFKGYEGFPASICSSVNEVVVHGIPGAGTVLAEGDLVSVDCGAILDGWHGDSAWTFGVGRLDPRVDTFNEATREVLEEGILAMRPGNRLTDVSHALEVATRRAEERHGLALGIVDGYGGHGIGREMHEWPFLANEGRAGKGPRLQVGSVLAVEPMLVLGGETATHVLGDDWTVVTADGAPASHWEHTVAVTPDGPRILTPRP
ncbi:MAG TPA: type I methionyl aminopeptidase [Actinomycetales bacterium]|nr:type I methionyl aminopeptidase [Actinomycetales bacterium]